MKQLLCTKQYDFVLGNRLKTIITMTQQFNTWISLTVTDLVWPDSYQLLNWFFYLKITTTFEDYMEKRWKLVL
mgnify:CR=1 FL=1